MFLHLSVILFTGGGLCRGEVSVQGVGGSLSGGGGVLSRGISVQGRSLSREVSVRETTPVR